MIEAPAITDFNGLFAMLYARSKDTPAKAFWDAEALHPAIFRALRMDRAEDGAIYAALAFRLYRSPDGPRILAAFPAPKIDDDDWLGIETVLSWDPVKDAAQVMGDPVPQIVGVPSDHAETALFASPFPFLRALAEARAQWFVKRRHIASAWHSVAEPDHTPGLLLIGAPDKVRWPIHDLQRGIIAHGLNPQDINRALLRQAHVPRAFAAPSEIRSAA